MSQAQELVGLAAECSEGMVGEQGVSLQLSAMLLAWNRLRNWIQIRKIWSSGRVVY